MDRTRLLIGLGAIVVLLIGVRIFISLATPKPVDPRVRVQQMFAEGKQAFENEDVDGMLALLADEFSMGGMNKQRLRYELLQFFKRNEQPRADLGDLQIEMFAGRIIVRTPVQIRWRDPQDPGSVNRWDMGVVEFEFRKFPQRKWLIISYEDWRLIRIEAPQLGDIQL